MSNGGICFFSRDWIGICIRLENLQLQFFQLDWDWIRISLRVEIYVKRGDLFFQQGLDLDSHPIRKSTTLVFSARLGLDSDLTTCRNLCQTGGFVFSVWIGFGFGSDQKICNFSFFSQIGIGFGFHCMSKSMSNGLIWFFPQGLDLDLHPIRKSTTLVCSARLGLDSDFTACRNLCPTGGFVFSVGIGLGFASDQKICNFSFFSQTRIGFGFHCVSKSMSNAGICFFSRDWIWICIRLENLQLQFFQLDSDWIRISLRVEIYVKRGDLFFQQRLDLDSHPIRKSTTLVFSARLGLDSDFTTCRNLCQTRGFVFSVGIGFGFVSDQKIYNFSFFSQIGIGFGFHCVSKSMSNGGICFFSRDWIWIPIRLENLQLQFFQLDWDQIRISLRVEIYVKRADLFFPQGLDLDSHPIRKSTTLVFSARLGLDSDLTTCRNLCQTGGFVFSVGIVFGFPSDQKIYNFSLFSQIGIGFGFHCVSKSMSNGLICFVSRDWIGILI